MAEEHDRSGKDSVGKAPWLKIFMGFKLALDPKKMLLAGAGIFITYLGWWAISWVFYNVRSVPLAGDYSNLKTEPEKNSFLAASLRWSLLHEMAGSPVKKETVDGWKEIQNSLPTADPKIGQLVQAMEQKHGLLTACPWNENRGPNQFMVLSRAVQRDREPLSADGAQHYLQFMIEPLYKLMLPVTYFFDGRAGGLVSWNRTYIILALLWMVAVWGFFGGAIARMAIVQLARNEKLSLKESLQFVRARWQGYVFAPILPLVALFVLSVILWFFGLFFGVTFVLGDIVGGLLWPLTMVMGLIMTVILVGLIGWPLMNATISTEGSDSFDALSRSYSYVFQVPWHCAGYALLSLVYGAVLVFFVGFMGSLVVYFGGWGVNQAHYFESRDPAFLYTLAPTSFEWREMLIKDSPNAKLENGIYTIPQKTIEDLPWYAHSSIGTYLVTFWLGLFFLLIIGFGYSYFWTAASIIYLLLRQKVDDTDLDEVYLDEEEDKPFMSEPAPPAAPLPGTGPPPASKGPPGVTFTMVDAPGIRPSSPDGSVPTPPAPTPAATAPESSPPGPSGNSPPPGAP